MGCDRFELYGYVEASEGCWPMEECLDWDVNDLSGDNKFDLVEGSMWNYETNCRDYI